MIHLIVAMTTKGIIGKNGTLPWHIPDDLKHFRHLTKGSNVVMGRKTFDSLKMPNGLPNRRNFVVSRNKPCGYTSQVSYHKSIEFALLDASFSSDALNTFIIGGATIYDYALKNNFVDMMHISFIKEQYDGDTKFPEFDKSQWNEIKHVDMGEFSYVQFKYIGELNRSYVDLNSKVNL